MTPFVHLHVHTQYSILDGASSISSLIKQAKEYEMGAIAITDHGNMYGAKEFYDAMNKAGLKPILGCEVYVVKNHLEKNNSEKNCHLILLAKNFGGYHNLIKIVSRGWTDGLYKGKPRVDFQQIKELHEGIICCSACVAGEVQRAISRGDMEGAEEIALRYKSVFNDDYYLEMQLHQSKSGYATELYQRQLQVNNGLRILSKKLGIKLIVTNDSHFTKAEDAVAHDHLLCLNTGKLLSDTNRLHFTGEEYFKSGDEMAEIFPDDLDAIANTLEIADKVERYELNRGPLMPNFPIPEDFEVDFEKAKVSIQKTLEKDAEKNQSKLETLTNCNNLDELKKFDEYITASQFQYLTYLTYKGAKERYGDNPSQRVLESLDFELKTIEWMGFPGYFLIVWDLLRAAREMGVSVGPGRGSAAGSVVAYCIRITNIDPLKYNLLFERFLNPERISLPDVDMDFDEDGRADVLDYCIQKYGREKVAQIVTFGTMAPKMSIKDIARIQNLDLSESNRLAKLIPDKITPDKNKHETPFEFCYNNVPELVAEKDSANELIRNTLKYAEELEGTIRQTGVHACGVIIGQDDLEKFAPIATAKDVDLNVVQYEGSLVEQVGLIKMDFLGLKTLSIIKDAIANIKQHRGISVDIDNIPMDDQLTYNLYCNGETTGIFQFESLGMKKYLKALHPSRFEDLIAMNALYRPGPMDYIPSFIDRKKGIQEIKYDIEEMEEFLKDTYGITVYQEQVMLLSQKLANFSKGEADTLRKAMGKKKRDVLDKMKPKFLEGAASNGHDTTICEKIWGDWEAFASYAFNKSHATCYAYVSYQTAYLKAHYPAEFMAAILSRNLSDITKISTFMDECKRMGLKVLGPDINNSMAQFAVDKEGNIRFGLAGIKGIGANVVDSILKERELHGDYKDIYDFVERVPLQIVNKKSVENLTLSGAFDNIWPYHRSTMVIPNKSGHLYIDQLIHYGDMVQVDRNSHQNSLFSDEDIESLIHKPVPDELTPWSQFSTLNKEKEIVGMYLSAHPLDNYKVVYENFCNTQTTELQNLKNLNGKKIQFGGIITNVDNRLTKKDQKPWGKITIEDFSGTYELSLFNKQWEQLRYLCMQDNCIVVSCTVQPNRYQPDVYELTDISIRTMTDILETGIKKLLLTINVKELDDNIVDSLFELVQENKGGTPVYFKLVDRKENYSVNMISDHKVNVTSNLTEQIKQLNITYNLE